MGLLLRRRSGEKVLCLLPSGEQVCITVRQLRHHTVQLNLEGPDRVRFFRAELLAKASCQAAQIAEVAS